MCMWAYNEQNIGTVKVQKASFFQTRDREIIGLILQLCEKFGTFLHESFSKLRGLSNFLSIFWLMLIQFKH